MGINSGLGINGIRPGICTSSTRPSNPYKGMLISETDTGNIMEYQGATTGWTPPWNTAWGEIARARATASVTIAVTPSLTAVMTTGSYTMYANRRYRLWMQIMTNSTVTNDIMQWFFIDSLGQTMGGTQMIQQGTNPFGLHVMTETQCTADTVAGARTLSLQGKRLVGTGACSMYADGTFIACLVVEDIGPSGAPL